MLHADDAVGRTQTERRDIRVAGQSRAGPVLSRPTAEHTRDGGHAHRGADHQDRGVPELRGHGHRPRRQHEGVQAPGSAAVQGPKHHLHQRVGIVPPHPLGPSRQRIPDFAETGKKVQVLEKPVRKSQNPTQSPLERYPSTKSRLINPNLT